MQAMIVFFLAVSFPLLLPAVGLLLCCHHRATHLEMAAVLTLCAKGVISDTQLQLLIVFV